MDASKKRAHLRVPTNVTVALKLKDKTRIVGGKISNISLGGVFIEMTDPLPFGSELELEFTLPKEHRSLTCQGFVVWTTKGQAPRPNEHSGIGVRLMGMGLREMRILADFVETQLKT